MVSMSANLAEKDFITSSSTQPWIVCFSAALFFFYEFIQMNMFNTISADLMRDFAINATQLGNLSAIYFYANLLFLPVAGMLLDRFSTRRIILATILLCAVGIGTFALAHSVMIAGIARFMSGIGSAFCFLSSIRLASRWFPTQRMALVSGLIVTMAMTGGMVAQTPLTFMVELVGWRHALLLDAGLGFIIAAIIWCTVRDFPLGTSAPKHDSSKNGSVLKSWRAAYLNWQNWLAGIFTSLMNLPIALLGAIWGNLYLQQVQHLSSMQSSYVVMMLFVGTIVGGPALGWFSDRIGRRRFPMILGVILSLVVVLTIMYVPALPLSAYLILFFGLGVITSAQVVSYPLVAESNPTALTATAVSVVSFCAISGYAIFQPLFGWFMDLDWHGTIVNNMHIYSANDFHRALLIIPVGFIFALLASMLLRETRCQRKE